MPKPSITNVKASEAVPRATPNSAWTVGSATTTDHMPTLPSEPISTATASRVHARRESGTNGNECRLSWAAISTAGATWSAAPSRSTHNGAILGMQMHRNRARARWPYITASFRGDAAESNYDVPLHIGESRGSGFAEPVIGPRFARTRWRPG